MNVCSDCKHAGFVSAKRHRLCKRKDKDKKDKRDFPICMNERAEGECGPSGVHWVRK